jgi:hypothetical protein
MASDLSQAKQLVTDALVQVKLQAQASSCFRVVEGDALPRCPDVDAHADQYAALVGLKPGDASEPVTGVEANVWGRRCLGHVLSI